MQPEAMDAPCAENARRPIEALLADFENRFGHLQALPRFCCSMNASIRPDTGRALATEESRKRQLSLRVPPLFRCKTLDVAG